MNFTDDIKLPPKEIIFKNFRIHRIDFPDYINEMGKLRIIAWEKEGIIPDLIAKKVWLDELDKSAIHWILLEDEKLVASARMTLHNSVAEVPYSEMFAKFDLSHLKSPVAALNRLVVNPKYKGEGIARQLDIARIETAKEIGIKTIIGEAVPWRVEPLLELGFKFVGQIGDIKEIPGVELTLITMEFS